MREHSREKDIKEEKEKVVEQPASRSNSSKYSIDSGGSSGQKHKYAHCTASPCGWLKLLPNFLIFFKFWYTSIAPNGQNVGPFYWPRNILNRVFGKFNSFEI